MTWSPNDDPDAFVSCRTLGHRWDSIPVSLDKPRATDAAVIRLRCTSCGTERTDTISTLSGEVEGRSYNYAGAPGYRHKGGGSRPRTEWRLAYLRVLRIAGRRR